MKPLIALSLPNHWAIKNFLQAGVLGSLQEEADFVAFAAMSKIESLKEVCQYLELRNILFHPYPEFKETAVFHQARLLQKSLLFEHHEFATERIAKKSYRGRRSRSHIMMSALVGPIARSPLGPSLIHFATRVRENHTFVPEIRFDRMPSAFLVTNPVDFREDMFVRWCQQNKVPTLTLVPSWDNLSSKGAIHRAYDSVMVWNEEMQEEVRRIYPNYALHQIPIVGVPRFDAYRESLPASFQKASLWPELGLDPNKKTILFANTASRSFKYQPEVIRHVSEAIGSGELSSCQLLVRLHPHDDPQLYESLRAMPNTVVWPALNQFEAAFGVESSPPANDLLMLAAMMRQCDVVLNAASTIALDAAVCDKPIISVAYDGDAKLSYFDSILSAYEYTHQQVFLRAEAAVLVHNKEEMIKAILEALAAPELRRGARAQLAESVVPCGSVAKITALLRQYLGASEPSCRSAL